MICENFLKIVFFHWQHISFINLFPKQLVHKTVDAWCLSHTISSSVRLPVHFATVRCLHNSKTDRNTDEAEITLLRSVACDKYKSKSIRNELKIN
jgi:hypothetical protein